MLWMRNCSVVAGFNESSVHVEWVQTKVSKRRAERRKHSIIVTLVLPKRFIVRKRFILLYACGFGYSVSFFDRIDITRDSKKISMAGIADRRRLRRYVNSFFSLSTFRWIHRSVWQRFLAFACIIVFVPLTVAALVVLGLIPVYLTNNAVRQTRTPIGRLQSSTQNLH